MQYIVNRMERFAIEDSVAAALDFMGYDTFADFAAENDYEGPEDALTMLEELYTDLEVWTDEELRQTGYVHLELGDVMTYDEIEAEIEESLDECYPTIEIGSSEWGAGEVLREMDPIAFRCMVADTISNDYAETWEEFHAANN